MAFTLPILSYYRPRLEGVVSTTPLRPVAVAQPPTVTVAPTPYRPPIVSIVPTVLPLRPIIREPVVEPGDLLPRPVAPVARPVPAPAPPPTPTDGMAPPVGMRLTTCSTCGEPMETPSAPAPKLAAQTVALDTTTAPDAGATPAAPATEGTGAPGQPKPGGSKAATVLLVMAGALAVIGLAMWVAKRRKKVAA